MLNPKAKIQTEDGMVADPDKEEVKIIKDLWRSVIFQSVQDYWEGIRKGLKRPEYTPYMCHIQFHEDNKSGCTEYARLNYRFEMAYSWLFSDTKRPRGFLWICDHLDLDPHRLRSEIGKPSTYAKSRMVDDSRKPAQSVIERLKRMPDGTFGEAEVRSTFSVSAHQARSQLTRWVNHKLVTEVSPGAFKINEGILE